MNSGFEGMGIGQHITILLGALLLAAGMSPHGAALGAQPPENEQTVAEGRRIYFDRCVYCHGEEGDGEGPVAPYLDPRPRDFTVGMFKLRTTRSGELPTDSDLFRVVSRGIPGTAMPRWELTLSETERWNAVYFIKTFSPEFADEEYDPEKQVVTASNRVDSSPQSIAKGREIFKRAKCFECHGREGRGDGQKSDSLEDGWGFKVRVRNLTRGWNIKGGARPEDIYYRFSTGINGTPMPSFQKTLSDEERWHLANFIASIASTRVSDSVVIKAARITDELPVQPDDPAWAQADALRIPLTGQVLVKPRWQNISVDMVEVKALVNDDRIALLVVWDDPFPDLEHHADQEVTEFESTYVKPFDEIPRTLNTFRDAVAVQFPVALKAGARKPHFLRGDASNPVNLWIWKSDLQEQGANPVEEFNARGFKKPMVRQPDESQGTRGVGVWKGGRWHVVITRSLQTSDVRQDVQITPGRFIPVVINVWDGSNGEHGLIMSLSSWVFLALEVPVPRSLYGLTVLVIALVFAGEWWIIRFSRRSVDNQDTEKVT